MTPILTLTLECLKDLTESTKYIDPLQPETMQPFAQGITATTTALAKLLGILNQGKSTTSS